jgi:hypothetical protein
MYTGDTSIVPLNTPGRKALRPRFAICLRHPLCLSVGKEVLRD